MSNMLNNCCARTDVVDYDLELALALQQAEHITCDDPNLVAQAVASNHLPAAFSSSSGGGSTTVAARTRSRSPPGPVQVTSPGRARRSSSSSASSMDSHQSAEVVFGPVQRPASRFMALPVPRVVRNNNPAPNQNQIIDPWDNMTPEQIISVTERIGDVKVQLSSDTKDKLEVKTADKEVFCSICRFECESGESLRKLPCGHEFHTECVDQWFTFKTFCPMCMQDVRDFFPDSDVAAPSKKDAEPLSPTATTDHTDHSFMEIV